VRVARLASLAAAAAALAACGGASPGPSARRGPALPSEAVEACFIGAPCRLEADLDGDRRRDMIVQVARAGRRGFAVLWGDRARPALLLGAGTVTPLRAMRDEADPDASRATAALEALPDDLGHLIAWSILPAATLQAIPDVGGDALALDDGAETWVLYLATDRTWSWIALGYHAAR
jgi:hypothetical protein